MMQCALALLLLMDVSGSVSEANWRAQRDGTADAFRDPAVARLIRYQENVAVAAIAWGSDAHVVVNWQILHDEASAGSFATRLAAATRPEQGQTNLANALRAAQQSLQATPCTADRQVIDISGDGPANAGDPAPAREALIAMGVVVNGLPIVTASEPQLESYYRDQVVTPGGFLVVAEGWQEFGQAIRRKLAMEVASAE
jgi:hypothetical protein